MPSHKFVPERSKNFTSHAQIRFPPTTPINPVFDKVPRLRTEKECFAHKLSKWIVKTDKRRTHRSMLCHSMLCHSTASGCLEHAVFFTVITTGGQGMRRMRCATSSVAVNPPMKARRVRLRFRL